MTSPDQVRQLISEAYALPRGAAQIALAEQAVAQADTHPDTDLPFDARMLATAAYIYGGDPVRAFVSFGWCRAAYDQDPARHGGWTQTFLWLLKSMVQNMPRFPEIGLAGTLDVLDDMERRWRAGGHSLNAVYQCRHRVARHVGDLDAAQEWYRRWQAAPRDNLSDCAGCDPTHQVEWLSERGQDEAAVALAEPVLGGRLGCSEQPQTILTALLVPYVRTGRFDDAVRAHRTAYRTHRTRVADLSDIATHLHFCGLTGNDARGLEVLQRHVDWLERSPTPWAEMRFAAAGALVLGRLVDQGRGELTVRRRDAEGIDSDIAVGLLGEELRTRALALAQRFDQRNGTTHQSDLLRELLDTAAVDTGLSLATPGTRAARPSTPAEPALAHVPDAEPTAPAGGPRTVNVDDAADPDTLLDQAEEAYDRSDYATATAAWVAFDRRVGDGQVTPLQRARREEGRGSDAHQQDPTQVEAHWSVAAQLYAEVGDELRRQTVLGRLGLLLLNRGDEAGAALVEASTAAIVASGDSARLARAHLRLALAHHPRRNYAEGLLACDRAEEQLAYAVNPALPGEIARLRVELLAGLGQVAEAESAADRARSLVRASDPTALPHACWLHGWTLEQLGRPDEAIAAYDEALANEPEPGFGRHIALRRAGLLIFTDRAAEAVEVLVEEVARLTAEGSSAIPHRQHELAVGYLNTGRLVEAAEVAEESLAALAGGEDVDQTWSTRRLLVSVYSQLNDHAAATDQLLAITDLLRPHAADLPRLWSDIGDAFEVAGGLLNALDRDGEAARAYAEAGSAYAAADQAEGRARVAGRYATSLFWAGDAEAAVAALGTADELVGALPEGTSTTYLRATTDYDAARVLGRLERLEEAAVRAARAGQGFGAVDAAGPQAQAALLLADVLTALDRAGEALAPLRVALQQLPAEAEELRVRLVEAMSQLEPGR